MNIPTKEQLKKLLFTKSGKPKCLTCGKVMKMAVDTITKKRSKYEWEYQCKCNPKGRRLCIG